MRIHSLTIRTLAPLCVALLFSGAVRSASADDASSAPSGLVAPQPTNTILPVYPEAKKATGAAARVGLMLSLDSSGAVTDVIVAQSAGPEFDAAAIEAAQKLTFSPARRDGKAIAARIRFSFDFAYEQPEPAPASADIAAPRGTAIAKPTDATAVVDSASSETEDPQDVEVIGPRPPREVTRRSIEQREIAKMPGANGDALRSLESMRGVARSPGLTTQLVVRGAGPNDTAVFVDGTPIPMAYHFGGLTSVVPTEALSRIDFTPGNFGAEYGAAMGGIVDVGLRSPRQDRWGGLVQADLLDARVMAEGPLGNKTRVLVGVRRSWVDAWLGPVLKNSGVGVTTAPAYYDGQVVLEHDLTSNTKARLAFIGADDRLVLQMNAPEATDPISGFGNRMQFLLLQARTDTRLSEKARWINTIGVGRNHRTTNFGDNFIDITEYPVSYRSDLRVRFSDSVTTIVGIDGKVAPFDISAKTPPPATDGQNSGPYFARGADLLRASGTTNHPAAYAMLELSPIAAVKLLPSVRADYSSEIKELLVSPRFATRVDLHPSYPLTTVKGGVGYYYQPPDGAESLAPFGTPTIKSNRALHTSFGFEQELSTNVEVSVEGFYKKLDHLVVQRPAAQTTDFGVDYANTGSGRVYGAEMMLRYKSDSRFFGWAAYTLSRSERKNNDADSFRTFEFDQTHILTLVGSYQLGRGWELGGRFRYVTGNPYTKAVAGIFDADAGAYAPVNGPAFGERSPAFHRLDVRIEKTWSFKDWKLSTYLDLQNAYARKNPEGRSYNFNYTRSDVVAGLPILPVIGLRGEL